MRIKVDFPSCSDRLPGCAAWPVQRNAAPSADAVGAFATVEAGEAFGAATGAASDGDGADNGADGAAAHADPANVSAAVKGAHA
jgi:hypothetical protein